MKITSAQLDASVQQIAEEMLAKGEHAADDCPLCSMKGAIAGSVYMKELAALATVKFVMGDAIAIISFIATLLEVGMRLKETEKLESLLKLEALQ
jgi:hypothetical protein